MDNPTKRHVVELAEKVLLSMLAGRAGTVAGQDVVIWSRAALTIAEGFIVESRRYQEKTPGE